MSLAVVGDSVRLPRAMSSGLGSCARGGSTRRALIPLSWEVYV